MNGFSHQKHKRMNYGLVHFHLHERNLEVVLCKCELAQHCFYRRAQIQISHSHLIV